MPPQGFRQTVQAKAVVIWGRLLAIRGDQERRIISVLCGLGVAIFGVWLTVNSLADTFRQDAEAETGIIQGNAHLQTDDGASGGGSVEFGNLPQAKPDQPAAVRQP